MNNLLRFSKMHGLGNDFIVIDGIRQRVHLTSALIAQLADRHTGIGFDQLLLIEPSARHDVDFTYRIFNADGNEVGQCGNGARCLALFAKQQGLTQKNHLRVATRTTEMNLYLNADDSVTVEMGIPQLDPKHIPLQEKAQASHYAVPLGKEMISVHALSVGNPHAVLPVVDVAKAQVTTLGAEISLHPLFPEQTNVGFMQILTPRHIRLRVYERGCGETSACGSGAVAAAAVGRLYYQLEPRVTVSLPGGDLVVDWPAFDAPITLTGPAVCVYEGTVTIPEPAA